jgi:hypothetical protein
MVSEIPEKIDLRSIQPLPTANEQTHELAQKELLEYFTNQRINEAKAAREEEKVRVLQQDRIERQKYAKYLFQLICLWLLGIYSIILLNGFNGSILSVRTDDIPVIRRVRVVPSFELSDAVLLALIGGTTINVLGLFVIVANYLFTPPKEPK